MVSHLAVPFTAVVGADEAKLALALVAIDPAIGGVLLRGDKGSAKTTLARGLGAVLPGSAPFVELPLGASEERVVGTLDLAAVLTDGTVRFQPGLLAGADGGVLYVDEVNLLADHLVDVLLDVATSGVNRVERDHLTHEHPARIVLVGSMNPEEGDLRPQLLDRFGLAVDVVAPADAVVRTEIVRRRLAHDGDRPAFAERWAADQAAFARRLASVRPGRLDDAALSAASEICAAVGAEGLRADLTLVRAAAAHAGWCGRTTTTEVDLRTVAPLVLAHRARRHPLDPPGPPPGLGDALDDVLGPERPVDGRADRDAPGGDRETTASEPEPDRQRSEDHDQRPREAPVPAAVSTAMVLRAPKAQQAEASGRRSSVTGAARGRTVGHRPAGPAPSTLAVVPTIAAAAARTAHPAGGRAAVTPEDLHEPVRETTAGNLLVLVVDASASMDADDRMRAVKGALLGLLQDAYQRRDRVALVTFGGRGASVALRPTGSIEVARARLDDLPTGGDTPLADGIRVSADLATQATSPSLRPLLVVVTDGRATAGRDPLAEAMEAARSVARRRLPAAIIDVEPPSPGALGLSAELAGAMGARLVALAELTSGALESTLRGLR
jgi:magnesium chelatase subunit D